MTGRGARCRWPAIALLLGGCTTVPAPPAPSPSPTRDLVADCATPPPAPLLDEALAGTTTRRDHLGIRAADLRFSDYGREGDLDDAWRTPLLEAVRGDAWLTGCLHDGLVAGLDAAADSATPAAGFVAAAAGWLGTPVASPPGRPPGRDYDAALADLCGSGGCPPATGRLPAPLAAALAPILGAMTDVLDARRDRYAAAGIRESALWYDAVDGAYRGTLHRHPHLPLLAAGTDALLHGAATERFHAAAMRLASAVETADLARFRGLRGPRFDQPTPHGTIRVRDAADHVHVDDDGPFLLLLDTGGDDRYLGAAAATRPGHPVSVLVDLGGDDEYGYPGARPTRDGDPPADDGSGRTADGSAPRTRSDLSRQAAARDGVALLFDLAGDDVYRSLAQSQGHAALGVAVLLDAEGDDRYEAETLAQGAALHGIAVAADLGGGDDTRLAWSAAQGFAWVGGAGLLYDGGGDDTYRCPHGDGSTGGVLLYPASQLPARGNASFCQGAGFGLRNDALRVYRSGGVGVLRDRGGDDRYAVSVYGQGVGYWQGLGMLADGGGNDRYDGDWYVQGAAAHYAVGVLADAAGDDAYGTGRATVQVQAGAGHDFAVGVLIDESGDDRYELGALAGGASNCNGVGVLVDNAGDDRYRASVSSLGFGTLGAECRGPRAAAPSTGVWLDAGGDDTIEVSADDTGRPGHAPQGLASEHGIGRDGSGDSGLHVSPAPR